MADNIQSKQEEPSTGWKLLKAWGIIFVICILLLALKVFLEGKWKS